MVTLFFRIQGANQLLWYYADLERKKCIEDADYSGVTEITYKRNAKPISHLISQFATESATEATNSTTLGEIPPDFPAAEINHCLAWRRFAK